jgi:beta-glucanase (GH16 family)
VLVEGHSAGEQSGKPAHLRVRHLLADVMGTLVYTSALPGMSVRKRRVAAAVALLGCLVALLAVLGAGATGPARAATAPSTQGLGQLGTGSATPTVPRPTLTAAMRHPRVVTLRGRTPALATRVALEKRHAGRWVRVKVTRAARHRFTLQVRQWRTTRYRVVAAGRSSRARLVTTTRDACGVRPRKANGTLWACTFVDNFSGASLDRTKWVPQTDYANGNEVFACHRDTPANVAVGGGHLALRLTRDATPAACGGARPGEFTRYSSGQVSTFRLFSQAYGRFEARIKNTATRTRGLHEAFWLWPDARYTDTSTWPESGEIDIVETYSAYPDLGVPYLHYTPADHGGAVLSGPDTNTAYTCKAARGVWNMWALEWTATRIQIFVNGRLCLTNTSGDPAFRKRYIVMLSQAMGQQGNGWVPQTQVPAELLVDYVRVWR